MAEPVNKSITIVVSTAAVPVEVSFGPGVRAQLHQAVRHASSRKRVAMSAGADERVDELDRRRGRIHGDGRRLIAPEGGAEEEDGHGEGIGALIRD